MRIYAGIDSRNSEKAITETLRQMKMIEDGEITDEELEGARLSVINSLVGLDDNPGALSFWYLPRALCGDFEQTPQSLAEKIGKLTKDDVVKCSRLVKLDTVFVLEGNEKQGEDNADGADEEDGEES